MGRLGFLVLNNRERDLNFNWFVKEEKPNLKTVINKITEMESTMNSISSKYRDTSKLLDLRKFNINSQNLTKEDKHKILKLKFFNKKEYINLLNKHRNSFYLSNDDLEWLLNKRKIPLNLIKDNKLFSVESFIDNEDLLDYIGITIHPILKNIVNYNPNYRGICIPLFDSNNNIINVTTRLINEDENGKQNKETMKYTQSVPEYNWWGMSNNIDKEYIWITEGIFDTFALHYINEPSISSSAATTNAYLYIQLLRYLERNNINTIKIFSDNDGAGRISSQIKKELFEHYNYNVEIYYSEDCKDAAEFIFENKNKNLNKLIKINNFTQEDFNVSTNHESTSILNKFITKI